MPKRILIVLLLFSGIGMKGGYGQDRIVKFPSIDSLLTGYTGSVRVLNFWATWCKPCVTELPYFEELNKNYSGKNVEVTLVSLDFKREFDSRVKPFIEKNNIRSDVLLLDEPDYNSWINKVDSSWSGAIPATIIITANQKLFFEKEFKSYEAIENIVKPLIPK
jgi:thiol-disulfide isomerase/thioredoxin